MSKRDQTVIWAKPISNSRYSERGPRTQPPLCSSLNDPDESWNVSLKSCITPYSSSEYSIQTLSDVQCI
ncbi:S-adenosyl-l-methionine-dependent methyltransferases superfamily protein [Thalictrum thalictroides]|uniref:S-adenosyl-l-methionine-dependent methyltransferases superfamily protein n=1 Tax=Thalictrum thalictroides TaxID=46969 RepID=A0A7J6VH71_THATH|nr:S-adenosyl-l-methionine-dependent methyltransferases superfamily protein [Thalictrum thalictroides]